ncbi:MAG: TonB-dependent receptor [Chitinophagaceae bacterium]|nr:TonB-dependent receptor [Chitinophagaceae bacterium]
MLFKVLCKPPLITTGYPDNYLITKLTRIMKIAFILLFTASMQVCATGFAQRVTLSEKNVSLEKVLRKIHEQSGYLFFYELELLKKARPVSIRVKDAALEEVLNICFKDQPLRYMITNKIIIVNPKEEAGPSGLPDLSPPPIEIMGSVKDEQGNPLADASIKLKGSTRGTTADARGNFKLQVPDAGSMLIISFIGYETREVVVKDAGFLNIVLKLDDIRTDAAIVIGYGSQKKSDLTGSLSSVSSKDFEHQPVTRLDQALQGRAAGVQVTNASGSPGGDVRIRIRGANSLTGDNSPLYVIDGFVGADFNNINAEDIANIVVLKDASSTAIYGSRGANGVILVTTKTGRKGGMQVDFMTRLSSSSLIEKFKTMNAADFATVVNERKAALTPAGTPYTPRFTDAEIAEFKRTGGTDWQDEIFRTGLGQEYQLGFSGGNERTSYRINGNYLNQQGIVLNSDFKRYSVRTNLTSQVSEKFSVRFNFGGTRRENHNTSGTGARGGAFGQALAWAPTTPVYDDQGNYITQDPTSSIFQNPVALAHETDNRDDRTNINALLGARYRIVRDLTFDVQVGIDYTNLQSKAFSGPAITNNYPTASRSSSENVLLQNTNNLTYKKLFSNVHSLEVTGVLETQKFIGTGFNVRVNGLIYPDQSYDNLALSTSSQVGSGYGEWSLMSLLGRVNYAFADKYLVSASLRRDGSSKFQGKNKYSVFPSAAIGWKLSEEPFMQSLAAVSNAKLRASWGLTGNQGINPYGTLSAYVTNLDDAGVVFNGTGSIVSGIILGNPGNPNLKWETTEQINAGADLEFVNGLISFSADYFNKKTRNLLLSQPVPGYLGGYSIVSNIGSMQNSGVEFNLGINAFRGKAFTWNSSVVVSFLKNKLLSLGEGRADIRYNEFILKPGEPIGSFFGYKYSGTYKPKDEAEATAYNLKPGDARYDDYNNDGVINTTDYQIIGNAMPKTTLGWNNTLTYRSFTLNIFFSGMFGMDKLNYSYAYGMLGSTDAKEVLFEDIKNRYIPGVNETSDIPAFSSVPSNSYAQTSRFIERADFVRLKNISLAYDIKRSALRNIAGISVFADAMNLLTFTSYKGIDPESNSNQAEGLNWSGFISDTQQGLDHGAYPNAKVFTVGVRVTF